MHDAYMKETDHMIVAYQSDVTAPRKWMQFNKHIISIHACGLLCIIGCIKGVACDTLTLTGMQHSLQRGHHCLGRAPACTDMVTSLHLQLQLCFTKEQSETALLELSLHRFRRLLSSPQYTAIFQCPTPSHLKYEASSLG